MTPVGNAIALKRRPVDGYAGFWTPNVEWSEWGSFVGAAVDEVATVDGHDGAVDEGAVVAHQELDHGRDVCGSTPATQRRACDHRVRDVTAGR